MRRITGLSLGRSVWSASLFLALATADASAQSACRGPDALGTALRIDVQRYTYATDTVTAAVRDSLRLPASESAVLVTDNRKCQNAVAALQAAVPGNPERLSGRVYLIAVGRKHFVVVDPDWGLGDPPHRFAFVFDSRWARLSMY